MTLISLEKAIPEPHNSLKSRFQISTLELVVLLLITAILVTMGSLAYRKLADSRHTGEVLRQKATSEGFVINDVVSSRRNNAVYNPALKQVRLANVSKPTYLLYSERYEASVQCYVSKDITDTASFACLDPQNSGVLLSLDKINDRLAQQ